MSDINIINIDAIGDYIKYTDKTKKSKNVKIPKDIDMATINVEQLETIVKLHKPKKFIPRKK